MCLPVGESYSLITLGLMALYDKYTINVWPILSGLAMLAFIVATIFLVGIIDGQLDSPMRLHMHEEKVSACRGSIFMTTE